MTGSIRRARGASDALQTLVDALAAELGRSVVIDDELVRMICTSRHYGDEDPVRIHTLLQGLAGTEAIRHVLAQGVMQWPRPGFLAGRDDLGLLPRYCVPLRERGHLLGVLMVVAPNGRLTETETAAIEEATPGVAAQLYADRMAADEASRRQGRLLEGLLGSDGMERTTARGLLIDQGLLLDRAHCVVSTVRVAAPALPPGQVAAALRGALEALVHTRTARGLLSVGADRAVLLQTFECEPRPEELAAQSRGALGALEAFLGDRACAVVGIGGRRAGLADAWISADQSRVAAAAARRLTHLERVGDWETLGEFAVLMQLPEHALNESLVPQPLRRLLEGPATQRLEETLRCFLENGGSAPRTAEALNLHRTSLYYRLRQIQQITGLDLDSGANRLLLHLGLRIRDLVAGSAPAPLSTP
ncbi:PucR family transcriptional regulator [Streptomyces sp. RerS4]|uniref:PucR family transcriptional regulator n=1 Tax=Streptomyces sp. RerS4 TaxID=2942449 RepID=UPI00201CA932|nr:PucR family transcriptional regulator [Streptomyces sp. RerS4]UQW99358.1 helix-turn-helix domain-containing protein [Streptomyces sp. RerS4]